MIYRNGELYLTGTVGLYQDEEHFTSTMVRDALARHGKGPLTVMINSGGGFLHEGLSIYNQIKALPGTVTVVIDGIAASAGSLIAMAGDSIVMRKSSLQMIHDPSSQSVGTAVDHENARKALDVQAQQLAEIYAARSGKSVADIRAIMKAETWFTPDEAVAAGFADMVDDMRSVAMARFAYAKAYRHPPETLTKTTNRDILLAVVAKSNSHAVGSRGVGSAVQKPARSGSLRAVMQSINLKGRTS